LIIPRKQTSLAISGVTKSLTVVEHPSGWTTERILWIVTPRRLPGWSILFQSTHTRESTLKHLLLKLILQRINKNEAQVLTMLVVALPEEQYEILELILSNQQQIQNVQTRLLDLLSEYEFLGIKDPRREFHSYVPEMFIFKMWTLETRVPPKRYIGVGYNDHGTLSTAPSWKDQQTDHGDVSPRLSVMLFSLRMIFEYPLYRIPPSGSSIRLTSSKQSETGRT
jgi:hypothetical protein